MSSKEERINALQIASDCVRLADQFRKMAEDYAKQLIECMEARRKTDEQIQKLIAALIVSGAIQHDPSASG
jgi:hypothetical protein